jgi:hypothetical protein
MSMARTWIRAALAAAIAAMAAPAAAVTCYVVMDRSDNVIYRSTVPPVDLSDQGKPARERMRERGEYLMFGEFEQCPGVTFFTGAGGSKGLALDEVVNGMPALPTASGASQGDGASASGGATMPARRAPAARGRGANTGSN